MLKTLQAAAEPFQPMIDLTYYRFPPPKISKKFTDCIYFSAAIETS